MSSYAARQAAFRRLHLLQLLAESPSYEATQYLLYQALPDRALAASLDQVAGDLAWLEEQGLVDVRPIDTARLARLTQRGADVAAGRASVPGVDRPPPGSA